MEIPFCQPESPPDTFFDHCDRHIFPLSSSLSRFGHRVLCNQASMNNVEMKSVLPTITRILDNTTTEKDFKTLFENFPPLAMKTRIIFLSSVLEKNCTELISQLKDPSLYEQVIFIHQTDEETFSIFVVITSQNKVEVFLIGENNMDDVKGTASTINDFFLLTLVEAQLTYCIRLEIPKTFPFDPTVLAYFLVFCIHNHFDYLELDYKTLTVLKLLPFSHLIKMHDQYFGKLNLKVVNN